MIEEMTEREATAWDVYFSGIVSLNQHPGTGRGESVKLTLEECADLADEMLMVRRQRIKLCLG